MAISDRIQAMYTHTSDIYDSVELTGVDTTDIDKNLVNVPNTLKEGYIDIINNGTDTLYNNFPKVSGEGTSLTLNNTYQAPMRNNLKGNTSQTGTPTPTSPIPVNVVSGDNTITISNQGGTDSNTYNIDLPVENLCNNDNILGLFLNFTNSTIGEADGSKTMYAKVPKNTELTVSRATLTNRFRIGLLNEIPQNGGTFYLAYNGDSEQLLSKTINSGNYEYVAVQYTNQGENTNIQIEKGSKANTYTPYGATPIELCKIGNYQDYFYKDSDKWYLHKEIGKYVDDGNYTDYRWVNDNYTTSNWRNHDYLFSTTVFNTLAKSGEQAYCNYYQFTTSINDVVNSATLDNIFSTVNTYNANMRILNKSISTNADFKAWLITHNLTIYYVLATPTTTEITDTTLINQLEELYIAKSKENQTNISQINNDLGFIINASALKKG